MKNKKFNHYTFEEIIVIGIIIFIIFFGGYKLYGNINSGGYNLFYKNLVIQTIKEQVKPECLQ